MKKEQLLEAIGYTNETLLMETETKCRPTGFRLGRVALAAAVIAILAMTAMASTGFFAGLLKAEENGSAVANLATGVGNYVYTEDGIYYGEPGFVHKCDMEGKIIKTYPLSDKFETPLYMFATKDAIVYVNNMGLAVEPEDETAPGREGHWGLRVLPLDGSDPYSICPGVEATHAYADGDQLYFTNGGTMLSRIDLVTFTQTDLLENVYSYFVDDTYIYAVPNGNDNWLFRSRKDAISFEKIELGFDPNKIIADGEDLYVCQWMDDAEKKATGFRYRVNLVRNGETIPLPVHSWFYQILDGCVLYCEEGNYILKCYDVATGETTVLTDNVFEFTVLADRYICIDKFNEAPVLYDWQTKEFSQIKLDK